MFGNIITFSATPNNLKVLDEKDYPTPAKLNIPEWFKKLQHTAKKHTAKGCIPLLDAFSAGYIIKLTYDLHINHKKQVEGEETFPPQHTKAHADLGMKYGIHMQLEGQHNYHAEEQLKESPLLQKNQNLPVHKFINPWLIKTPPGYSCLFTSPLNNPDDRFEAMSGIVDTDTFNLPINFPFIINSDKYYNLETIIKRGTPIIQIIPFKRESWKMKIKETPREEFELNFFKYSKQLMYTYKENFWSKKSWK